MDDTSLDEVFDSDYEHIMRHAHTAELNRAEAELAMGVGEYAAGMQVLDAACGYGRITMELAERGPQVHGIDRSAPLIASGRAEAARRWCAARSRWGPAVSRLSNSTTGGVVVHLVRIRR
jgi:2-polyprenyl-3-methyl-5-hydroxy-6-metoxy-1,4-benzoquinol methylase